MQSQGTQLRDGHSRAEHLRAATARWKRGVPVVLVLLRLGMAAVFIGAAIPKIAAPDLFALSVHNYQMLPSWGVNALAIFLPWLELVVGVCLALGLWSRACAVVMAAMMVVFMVALGSAAARGLSISCGCFEVGEHAESSSLLWAALRDVAFLAAAIVLVRADGGPQPIAMLRWLRRTRTPSGAALEEAESARRPFGLR